MPVHNVAGEIATHMARLGNPPIDKNKKPLKYELPSGSHMVLDVHPRVKPMVTDPKIPIYITEGCKKVDALISRGQCAVGVLGVWGFLGTNEEEGKAVLPDWRYIAMNGRQVSVVYDSDVMQKESVHKALKAFAGVLKVQKAHLKFIYLPHGPIGEKVGVDDFFVQGRNVDDLLALAEDKVKSFPKSRVGPGERVIKEFNQKHAVVMVANKRVVLREEPDPITGCPPIEYPSPSEMRKFYANRNVLIEDGKKERRVNCFDPWMGSEKQRQYEGIVFDPSGKVNEHRYNLWHGFAVEPELGDCTLYLAHILFAM